MRQRMVKQQIFMRSGEHLQRDCTVWFSIFPQKIIRHLLIKNYLLKDCFLSDVDLNLEGFDGWKKADGTSSCG